MVPNPIKMDDLGVFPLFLETSKWKNPQNPRLVDVFTVQFLSGVFHIEVGPGFWSMSVEFGSCASGDAAQ